MQASLIAAQSRHLRNFRDAVSNGRRCLAKSEKPQDDLSRETFRSLAEAWHIAARNHLLLFKQYQELAR